MKTFVEEMKELRDNYYMGFTPHAVTVGIALDMAVRYIGVKRWNDGYERIVRSLFPAWSRKVIKRVQTNGYDTDTWTDKIYFELCR